MKRLIPSVVFGLALLLLPGLAWAQQGTVTGTVTEAETGNPLPGATVQIVEEGTGAASDAEGQYRIAGVPAGEQTVRVSFVGYQEQERTVNVPAGGTVRVNFQLQPQTARLEEVVKIGYGERERQELTGSVSSVSAAEIEDVGSVGSPEELLSGTAGVNVTSTSGLAGQAVSVSVRGVSSLNGNSQPLYVLDGTPITSASTGGGFGQGTNALSTISSQNIQSIEVLKGASATAIYGSRAANGVVLIETKKGSSRERRTVTASYQLGGVTSTSDFDDVLLDAQQWSDAHQEATRNFFETCDIASLGGALCGPTTPFSSYEQLEQSIADNNFAQQLGLPPGINIFPESNTYEEAVLGTPSAYPESPETQPWLEEAQQTGITQQANLSVSGGDDDTQYFISGVFSKDESFVVTNQFNRFTGRVNVSQEATDWLEIGTNTSVTRTENFQASSDNNVSGVLTSAGLIPPFIPIRNDDGSFNFSNPWNIAANSIGEANVNDKTIRNWRVLSTSFVEAQPLETLTLRAEGGIDALIVDDFTRNDRRTTDGAPNGFGSQIFEEERRYSIRGTATYDRTFAGRHDISAVAGASFEDSRRNRVFSEANNFPSAQFRNVASGSSPATTIGDVVRKDGLASFFTRATYTLDGKYTLEGSFRRDGSSRFSEDNEWGNFGSASFAYRIGQENFMQQVETISNLKLRGSIGWIGNRNIGGFFPQFGLASAGNNYNEVPGVVPAQLSNPDLKWESTRSIEAGLDLGLVNDRIFLTSTYFRSRTNDLITDRQLPYNSGFASVTQNRGELLNEGIEAQLETQNLVGEDFQWSTTFTVSWQRNEVQDLPGGEPILSGPQRAIEGEELSWFMLEYAGVNPDNGKPLWIGTDGEPTSSPSGDAESVQGGILPNWTGGFSTTANYKGFDLRASLTFEDGHSIYNDTRSFLMGYNNFGLHENALDRWQEPGDQTDVPRAVFGDAADNSTQESTRFLEDGGYLRLQNVTVGYTLPEQFTSQFGVRSLRVYFQGSNLFTLDDTSIGDPEGSTGGATSPLNRGELFFTPPQARSFTGGVELQL
ncbi:SusC/RagA family TonB-linked outer membrane protein [Salinibacter ruber]|uniref:SusC/RagA family TonB-linked outer membrane protein n=1 Tax=Salinibacter ruber TaxID=146919 RepID=UPI000E58D465|nr:SusC/RagA family TonB-linked outer membrane protein [Salinibacter ruber]